MKKAIIPAVILTLFAGLGCDLFSIPSDGDGDGESDWQEPLTPRAVIEDIVWCYNHADGPSYGTLLDHDNFIFYFDPNDVGGGEDHDIPDSWLYQAEVDATQNLFNAVGFANIALKLEFTGPTEPNPGDVSFTMNNVNYDLSVYDENADPQPTQYVAHGYANFELSKFAGDTGLRWWLTKWDDHANNG
jgi:hypothetical protein